MARRQLPPLNALRAFEAFGRHGRMTLAAEELCVTHGAVSRQIRQLEDHLGVALTEGPRSRLRMTEAGLKLAQALTPAFDQIAAASPRRAPDGPRPLVVSCLPTFAMKWLIPRLPGFQATHPEIPVRVAESNGPFDFKADGVDLAIRMRPIGDDRSDDSEVTPFMDHFHGPVMAPERARAGMDLAEVLALPRLLTRTFVESWSDWALGLAVEDLPAPASEQEFDHYFYMLEAAAAGLGVAIGPWAFVQRDLASGRLVAPLGFIPGRSRIVALTPIEGGSPRALAFRDWLLAEGASTPLPPQAACDSRGGR
ncbi:MULTISPECIES: LysR substrate-binding domain-containing protein [Caulobacter]|jgi:LysR family glycine cleavage system transcriptional activator|uniref:Transcriptional regulator n=1 Tax=Caulobacter vibrioides OR37 TaxID=1292034 RepID=R0EGW7_CAUVI|nr:MULTISPECIES: LysR substrate-binding domain-containing protein [Caulobacter]ENZ81259.1 transcriptional regulator [Caulobacter vibrioides OR37]MBQ1560002.1 LysR family transcriptional regulator [Caulobacter sp.]